MTMERLERRATIILFGVLFLSGTAILIVNPVLPQVAASLGVDVDRAAHMVTVFALAAGVSALVFGPISGRIDRRTIIILGLLVLGLGTLGVGYATNLVGVLAGRVIAGIGGGMLVTAVTAYVADRVGPARRGVVIGYVMNGFAVAMLLGVAFGALLANTFGWAPMFQLLGGAMLGLAGVALLLLPRGKPKAPADRAFKGVGATLAGASGDYLGLLRSRRVWAVVGCSSLNMLGMSMFVVYLSPWLEIEYGYDTFGRGLVYAVGAPAAFVAAPLAGKLSHRYGRPVIAVVGNAVVILTMLAMSTAPLLGYWLAQQHDSTVTLVAIPVVVLSLVLQGGSATRASTLETLTLEVVATSLRGSVVAARYALVQVTSGLGVVLGGLLWGSGGRDSFFVICGAAALSTGAATVLLVWLVRPTSSPRGQR